MFDVETLNAECACISLDREALCRSFEREVGNADFCKSLVRTHPTLVSAFPVFVSRGHMREMAEAIAAIESVSKSSGYRAFALRHAPEIGRAEPGPAGVFMSYDFHLGEAGPRLIEINTNAGGALINAFVARAQKACCEDVRVLMDRHSSRDDLSTHAIVDMFRSEFALQFGGARKLKRIAIVDDAPTEQYLYPEFVLFQHLFEHHGIAATIAAPHQLEYRDGRLLLADAPVDLVYNRLTDFALAAPEHSALRAAYLGRSAVVTPHPHAHALLADKRNLAALSDAEALRSWGIASEAIEILKKVVPRTVEVTRERAGEFWEARARFFFKPYAGFGGRAAYRGDKLTRRVWENIASGGYVAQELVSPSSRTVIVDGEERSLKVDIRNYTYRGRRLLAAARLYQGQTTNFRTPGGGFAPILTEYMPEPSMEQVANDTRVALR